MHPRSTPVAWSNVLATGILFGVLQWSAFFLLQTYLASTALVWLLATAVWLAGSLAGLLVRRPEREALWLGGAVLGYYALYALAINHPYDYARLPPLLACVALMGAYAGRFFRSRQSASPGAAWLFFWENNGFVLGLLLVVALLYLAGPLSLLVAPGTVAVGCLLTLPGPHESAR